MYICIYVCIYVYVSKIQFVALPHKYDLCNVNKLRLCNRSHRITINVIYHKLNQLAMTSLHLYLSNIPGNGLSAILMLVYKSIM